MKNKISTGIWLIFFGVIVLLHNFKVIDFNFYAIWKYWPLLLVSIGLNLLLQNRQNGNIILAVFNVIVCVFLTVIGVTSKDSFSFNWTKTSNTITTTTEYEDAQSSVDYPYNDAIEEATLELNLGAASLSLGGSNDIDLLRSTSNSDYLGLKLESEGDDIHKKLILNSAIKDGGGKKNSINLSLNTQPIWNLEFNIGAAKFDADLTKHKFKNLEINAGAASFDIKLGEPQVKISKIEISTAASNCEINIPKDAACQIDMDSFLSSKKFDGFVKVGDKQQTPNFDTASKKYIIEISGAVNSLKINSY